MKKRTLATAILISLFPLILFLGRVQAANEFFSEIRLIIQVYQIIQNEYIEKVNSSKLIEGAIRGMLQSLDDSHSRYLTSEEWEEWSIEKEGQFGGLGMAVGVRDEVITIIEVFEGTPASKTGLRSGDKIVRINGESTEGMNLNEVVSRLRGKSGTQVSVTVEREGAPEPIKYTITRDIIKLPNIKKKVLEKDIGYVRVVGFTNEDTSKELADALTSLKQQGITSVILDLRDNPGGLLSQAVEVADEFLSSGTIVSIKGRDPAESNIYSAHPGGEGTNLQLVVLINHGSASASEIVAGAIKDHQAGVLIGTSTFGKGTVQNAISLENGGAVWLTTAKYYTPSGTSIEGEGIDPTVQINPFTPSSEEKQVMQKLHESQTVEQFLQLNPQWGQKELDSLINKIKQKEGITVEESILKRVLRQKDANEENDIWNDHQLTQALNLLKSLPALQKKATKKATTTP